MTESNSGASPKSPRYFYTDPLAGAWMAEHFGMRFKLWTWNNLAFQFLPDRVGIEHDTSKLHIHPDSVHLMEPKEGDLVYHRGMYGRFDHCGQICVESEAVETICYSLHSDDFRIIQRNGIAFHCPESEAA